MLSICALGSVSSVAARYRAQLDIEPASQLNTKNIRHRARLNVPSAARCRAALVIEHGSMPGALDTTPRGAKSQVHAMPSPARSCRRHWGGRSAIVLGDNARQVQQKVSSTSDARSRELAGQIRPELPWSVSVLLESGDDDVREFESFSLFC